MSEPSYLAAELHVVGVIEGDEDLFVAGTIDGDVLLAARLVIEPTGIVRGDVTASQVIVRGQLSGNVRASELIRVESEAQLLGDLAAPRVVVAPGARFRGKVAQRIAPRPALTADAAPPPSIELLTGPAEIAPQRLDANYLELVDEVVDVEPADAQGPPAPMVDALDTIAGALPAALRVEAPAPPPLRIALPRRAAARRRRSGEPS